jgi:dTDP-4-amino-4,6-dideoxygalactose transaminase
MEVLFNNFKKKYKQHESEIDSAIKDVLESGYFILGDKVKRFEEEFAAYIGTKHAIGVANGLEALQISLLSLGIGQGDEVITTPHSAVATTLAIVAVGAKPVFVDIDECYHLDADKIEEKITSKTKCILPVHLFGQAAEIDSIMEIAKKHNLSVVEDAAQAHGAEFKSKKVGAFGDTGCFSFYPTKNLGSFGDAGMVVTDNDDLAGKCRMIRNYGQKNRYEHEAYGINSRLSELQASILRVELPELDKNNEKRRRIADQYVKELAGITQVTLPQKRDGADPVYHLFVIEIDKRDELQKYLATNGITTLIHYPIPIHKQKCLPEHNDVVLPIAEEKSEKILSLPIHPYLDEKEVEYVCQHIKSFFHEKQ